MMLRILVSALLALGFASAALANDAVKPVVKEGETLVLIEARGLTKVAPEIMTIEVGVVTTGKTAAEAIGSNNVRMSAVLDQLKSAGTEPSNIQTSEFEIEPQFRDDDETDNVADIVGYRVTNEVTVSFKKIMKAGVIVSSLFDAGANTVSSPSFSVNDDTYERLSREVEKLALKDAEAQVQNLADALGMKVSRILRLSNAEIDFDRGYRGRGGGYIVVTGSRIVSTPIEPGELPFSAELFVEYALIPK